jgi:D-3-phosphoglycerate dehydrogenase
MRTDLYCIWFERPLPPEYAHLLEGVAVAVEPESVKADTPRIVFPGAHGIVASSRVRYDASLMDQVPTLRVIARTGMGVDNISIQEATQRGIAVCNVPGGPTMSTAEHAVTLMLAVAKQLKRAERMLKRGGGVDFFNEHTGLEVFGRRLGLIGLGRIGSRVAEMATALGMVVAAFDPLVPPERAAELGVDLEPTLEALLSAADIVSIHAPLMEETHQLINADRLAQMKPGAILVNTARGGLVDEAALLDALESGHLGGAGLDVFDPEPPALDNPLLHRDDVVATPHIASATGAGKDRLWHAAIGQVLQVFRGERPPHLVNPEVWPPDRPPEVAVAS